MLDFNELYSLAIQILHERDIMAEALMIVAEQECCDYGRTEAFDIAERVTREREERCLSNLKGEKE